jgi:DNA-binding response OmpR family regulator
MIVEDDVTARRAMSALLSLHGFVLSEAGTVAEAFAGLVDRPAWVLLDIMLPDGNGIEVLRRIRESDMNTRVCIITGCDRETLEGARRSGADHVLSKPLNINAIIELLSK